ncbi:unnamed protein product [Peniophora sp. CBMAI 1063]|nr:unnamed protein product [Peniophora sp. CBMAI 1063]
MAADEERVGLPANYQDADVDHICQLLAIMFERLTSINDQIQLSPEHITRFHSANVPPIPIIDYLRRIVRFTNVERTCLLSIMHYIDLICSRLPNFTLCSLTVHRIIITAVTCGSKALCDAFCTNSHYARVGGLPPLELARLEIDFLAAIDWRLVCTREVLQVYYENLALHSGDRFYITSSDATESDADSDVELLAESRSPSPSEAPASAIVTVSASPVVLTAQLSPEQRRSSANPAPPPTIEQEAAFEQFKRSTRS